jgi:hypothetical protein
LISTAASTAGAGAVISAEATSVIASIELARSELHPGASAKAAIAIVKRANFIM